MEKNIRKYIILLKNSTLEMEKNEKIYVMDSINFELRAFDVYIFFFKTWHLN